MHSHQAGISLGSSVSAGLLPGSLAVVSLLLGASLITAALLIAQSRPAEAPAPPASADDHLLAQRRQLDEERARLDERKRRLDREFVHVTAEIKDEGAGLSTDNLRDLVIEVRKKVPTLVVDGGGPESRSSGGDLFHVETAFSAAKSYEIERRRVDELAKTNLDLYPSIIFLNVPEIKETAVLERLQAYVERGGSIARKIGLSENTAQAIYSLDEHWDGNGFPQGSKREEIPLASRIMNLCQTLEVFATLAGPDDAFQVIQERSGTWFDPELVHAAREFQTDAKLWLSLESDDVRELVMNLEPIGLFQYADDARIDNICEAFHFRL